jgi:uncharacterized tellurite resistance protein B-like protein
MIGGFGTTVQGEAQPQVAPSQSGDSIATLLAAMVLADGVVDAEDLVVAHAACLEFDVLIPRFEAALEAARVNPIGTFAAALAGIEDPGERERLASILFDIASADEKIGRRETELLEAMRQAWGVSVAFFNKPIVWDAEQKHVIEARRFARQLVSAGPGMGKTAVACSRVAHLVEHENVADSNIWLVSFTRSAIAELKGRIGDFAEDPSNVFAVKISTIDSQAWKIRYGFSPEQAEKLFGGFETGIDSALELMNAREDDFRDAFGDLEHLIIDEAQDITGGRARFLLRLIELLPPRCGVTIFHDPAQAIYDYAAKGEALFRFTDGLRTALDDKLLHQQLKRIYRTEEPALLKLYEDLRLDILGNADHSPASFKAQTELVRNAAVSVLPRRFDQTEVTKYSDALVLFRKRIEVAQASAFMASAQIPHRLRMSRLPRMPLPWLALTLGDAKGRTLSKSAFVDRCQAARETWSADCYGEDIESNLPEARWEQLGRYGRAGADIDLFKLRQRLFSAAPDEFVMPDFAHRGPILGTIHASKGREADHVFLQIDENWGTRENARGDLAEEARVLFVGATRAKRSLSVQGGFAMKFATETDRGRAYRRSPKRRNGLQFELGLEGDFDCWSAAAPGVTIETVARLPLPFKCAAECEAGSYIYRLRSADGLALGALSKTVNYDFFEIIKEDRSKGRKPPSRIDNINVMGFGTMIAPPGDERLKRLRPDAAQSGFWLVPLLYGLPMAYLSW